MSSPELIKQRVSTIYALIMKSIHKLIHSLFRFCGEPVKVQEN